MRLGRALLDAYPGHFLAADEDAPWAIDLRDRLRSKLMRTVLGLGERLQAAGRWTEAVALYERALELDNLAEGLYRGLMICHRELGSPQPRCRRTAGAASCCRSCWARALDGDRSGEVLARPPRLNKDRSRPARQRGRCKAE